MLGISQEACADRRKQGLDLTRLAKEGSFAFVDGLSDLFGEDGSDRRPDRERVQGLVHETVLKDPKLAAVEKSLLAAIEAIAGGKAGSGRTMLVLDGIDFLLAATDVDAQSLTEMLAELCMVRYQLPILILCTLNHPLPRMLTATRIQACRFHRHYCLGRLSTYSVPQHSTRDQPCHLRDRLSPSSDVCYGTTAPGYRHGEGCQWSPEDYEGAGRR